MEIAAPAEEPRKYDKHNPDTPEMNANIMERLWYCFRFVAIFLAAAAGSTSREFRINKPTQEIERVTTTAMIVVNRVCINSTGILREDANCGYIEDSVS